VIFFFQRRRKILLILQKKISLRKEKKLQVTLLCWEKKIYRKGTLSAHRRGCGQNAQKKFFREKTKARGTQNADGHLNQGLKRQQRKSKEVRNGAPPIRQDLKKKEEGKLHGEKNARRKAACMNHPQRGNLKPCRKGMGENPGSEKKK